ncbi:MAG TPA: NADPH:quinone oxidoreductase family protein, partial [Sphingopyxis sp.]|nr:NADPH:quinone oxidoreductase family protein [Sphingopyxis sp.]
MKALLSTATGGPETLVLGELPRPTAGKGQIVIDVKACAVNFPDVLIIEDKY